MFASDSLARTFAINVLPQPGGPYSKIPLCGSTPNLTNNSGCFNGSSTISRIDFISCPSPPTSSYVTLTFLSPDASVEIVRFVALSILTMCFGDVLLILKSIEFPKIITEISSPWVIGNPFNLFFTKSVNSLSTVTESLTGISTTDFAIFDVAFLIFTISFNDAPTFFLVCPSILIISADFSSSSTGQTTAQLVDEDEKS